MNIEDIVVSLALSPVITNKWDTAVVSSFYMQINLGRGFTEKQRTLSLRILKRYITQLSQFHKQDLTPFLANPIYRLSVRTVNNDKKISIIETEEHGKCISAVFPYSDDMVQKIRKNKDSLGDAVWDKERKSWIFSLCETNIQFLSDLTSGQNFDFDEEFDNYVQQVKNITDDFEKHVPILCIEDKILKFRNFSVNLPPLVSTELVPSLFEARQKGISTWDETICNFVESDEVDHVTRLFLKSEPDEKMYIDNQIYPISVLSDIVTHMTPCLFVIPGGSEIEKLSVSYEFLKTLNFANEEMSVMFRLPTEGHLNFNNFVKNTGLNNPISSKTKIVFVSSKLPKPIIQSKIKFHSVINLGITNVHYTMREFIKNHENLVFFSTKKEQKDTHFAFV
jgi:hypothetical protein